MATADRLTEGPADGEVTIHVTSNGWHSGIVVARENLATVAIPETADFPEARYFSFGWGDSEYYPAPRPTLGMTLNAVLRPTPAVVHLAGLGLPPRQALPQQEVIDVKISHREFQRLQDYLAASFDRPDERAAEPVAPGLYRHSRFYPGTGKFHLFNTCNTWTAKGLRAAGVPIDVAESARAEDLMSQLRRGDR